MQSQTCPLNNAPWHSKHRKAHSVFLLIRFTDLQLRHSTSKTSRFTKSHIPHTQSERSIFSIWPIRVPFFGGPSYSFFLSEGLSLPLLSGGFFLSGSSGGLLLLPLLALELVLSRSSRLDVANCCLCFCCASSASCSSCYVGSFLLSYLCCSCCCYSRHSRCSYLKS